MSPMLTLIIGVVLNAAKTAIIPGLLALYTVSCAGLASGKLSTSTRMRSIAPYWRLLTST